MLDEMTLFSQEWFAAVPAVLREPLSQAFSARARAEWFWLLVGFLVTDLIYRIYTRPKSTPFWSYSAPWRIYTHRSALLDYKFFLTHIFVSSLLVFPLLLSTLYLGQRGAALVVSWFGPGPMLTPAWAAVFGFLLLESVLFDLGHYISHFLQHKVPVLWEFHKIHHSAEVLTPVTAFRTHPLEAFVDNVCQVPLQSLALSAVFYLYGPDYVLSAFVGSQTLYIAFSLISMLRHSHAWVSYGLVLDHVFSSPAQHQIHHSRAARHIDRNFSQYYSFLDWFFGTLYVPARHEELEFGLAEGPDPELQSVWAFYWTPVQRAFAIVRGRGNQPGRQDVPCAANAAANTLTSPSRFE